jgi:putative sigma-54 modulation protein
MRIVSINGTNIDLTATIKEYIENKLKGAAKLCEKFEPCDVRADVGKTSKHHHKGDVFKAEFNLTIPGTMIRAEAIMDDLYAAIDKASDDLKRQVKKYKEKLRDADRVSMESVHVEHEEEY